jgi:hypothetical protein
MMRFLPGGAWRVILRTIIGLLWLSVLVLLAGYLRVAIIHDHRIHAMVIVNSLGALTALGLVFYRIGR